LKANLKNKDIKYIIDNDFYVLIDTREKKNHHIIKAFDKYNIKYKMQKLEYGDYGCLIVKNENLGILDNIQLKISIERKANLEEIGSNLTKTKNRFAKEMKRCVDDGGDMIIMIENATYDDIADKNYKNDLTPKQFLGLIHGIYSTYKIPFIFISKKKCPLFIYDTLKYFTRAYLKNYVK